jgi:hypothetical protein
MDLASKWSDRSRSGASSARCLSGLHFRIWRRGVSMMAITVVCDEKSVADKAANGGVHSAGLNSETTSIVPTMFSFNFSRSAAGIQYSRCSELPTVCTL